MATVWAVHLKGPVTVPSCYFCRHKSPTLHRFTSRDQKRFSWWMLLPATHWDHSCLRTMYGTVQMCEASKHNSTHAKYHLSHKLETRHLLKIRSCALLRRPCGIVGGSDGLVPRLSRVLSLQTCVGCINNMSCELHTEECMTDPPTKV